jgi:hypothetical protein
MGIIEMTERDTAQKIVVLDLLPFKDLAFNNVPLEWL